MFLSTGRNGLDAHIACMASSKDVFYLQGYFKCLVVCTPILSVENIQYLILIPKINNIETSDELQIVHSDVPFFRIWLNITDYILTLFQNDKQLKLSNVQIYMI